MIFLSGVYTSFTDHCKIEAADSQLPDLVDYDEYDAKVFRNPSAAGHFALKGFPPRGSGFRRIRSAMEMQRMAKSVSKDEITSHKFISPKGISSYEDLLVSASSSSSTMLTVSNKLDLPTSRAQIFSRARSASGRFFIFSAAKANKRAGANYRNRK